jgi:hypothetical protein
MPDIDNAARMHILRAIRLEPEWQNTKFLQGKTHDKEKKGEITRQGRASLFFACEFQ